MILGSAGGDLKMNVLVVSEEREAQGFERG